MWLIIMLVSAWLAYTAVDGERRARSWGGATSVGWYLAAFGAISVGLLGVYERFLRPKLVDDFPSENTLLIVGLIVIAALVVMILDLLGMVDIMGQINQATNRGPRPPAPPRPFSGTGGPGAPGGPAGPGPGQG